MYRAHLHNTQLIYSKNILIKGGFEGNLSLVPRYSTRWRMISEVGGIKYLKEQEG